MSVTLTVVIPLDRGALQALAAVTLALPSTLVASVTVATVAILLILPVGMDVVVAVQTLVKGDENESLRLDGNARTTLILTRTTNDGVEVAVALLTEEYGMMVMMMMLPASGIAVLRPRSRPPLITSVYALVCHPSLQ
jgi:acyl-CoA synthetase (AMP-forming)/AMP-acid ligase II